MNQAHSEITQYLIGQALNVGISAESQAAAQAHYAAVMASNAWARDTYDFKVAAFLRTASPHWLGVMTDIEIGIWEPAK